MSQERLLELRLPSETYRKLKKSYKDNDLWREWYRKYPKLFTDNDQETLENQAYYGAHFHEFYSAVILQEKFGWLSLVEKAQHSDHVEKHRIITQLGSPALDRAMRYIRTEISPRYGPDSLFTLATSQSGSSAR
jgi:hypothetical protein